jgi:ABC-type branched-subunit amino acid transport system substrate-binding protein
MVSNRAAGAPAFLLALAGLTIAAAAACSSGGDNARVTPAATPTTTAPAGLKTGPGITGTEIRLGMTNDLTGAGDTPYAAVSLAMNAYFRKVNLEAGGVCGRSITLAVDDDRYNPQTALEKTQSLLGEKNVVAIVGSLGTQAHQLVGPFLNDPNKDGNPADGIPDLFVSTGSRAWGDVSKYPWTVAFIPDYGTDAAVLARYVNDRFPQKKVGIIYQNDDFGNDYLAAFKAALANPAQVVSEHPYGIDDHDLTAIAGYAKADGAEVELLASTPDYTVSAMKAAQTAGWQPQLLISYVNAPSTLASLLGGGSNADALLLGFRELAGAISTAYLISPVEDETSDQIKEHKRIMETYSGPQVSSLSVYGQALAETTVATLRKACAAGDLTYKGLLTAAESLRAFHPTLLLDGIDVNLGPQDHRAIESLQPIQVQADGTMQNLGDVVSLDAR